jgi:hypothetical protein
LIKREIVMNSHLRTLVATALTVTVLGVGSALGFEAIQDTEAAWPSGPALLLPQGFADRGYAAEWDCTTHSWTVKPALILADRWNGSWQSASGNFSGFVWAACRHGWAFGYLNRANANPELARIHATPPFVR